MANTVEVLPKAEYEIVTVGPSKTWGFDGNDGARVEMATDALQLKGHEEFWIDLNRPAKADPPKVGDKITGNATQDEAGKFPPKFNKEKKGGWNGGRGGGAATPGQIWGSNVQIATSIVNGYFAATGSKPKNIADYLARIESLAPKVNAMVDKLAGANKPAEKPAADTAASESGESPAPKAAPSPATVEKGKNVTIEDISDEDLGDDW